MIVFTCADCRHRVSFHDELAGKKVGCPGCRKLLDVPQLGANPTASLELEAALPPRNASCADEKSLAEAVAAISVGAAVAGEEVTRTFEGEITRTFAGPGRELCDFLAPPEQPDEIGRLGPFRVLRVLGAGGMGVVFKAEDPRLKRPVALKAMLPSVAARESSRKRFVREAKAAAALDHDHIVPIFQVGEACGVPFLAMQLLEGESLAERLRHQPPLTVLEMVRIGRETALGLAAAHRHGLIHRDIKPANLWLESRPADDFRVKILDFGLARATDDAELTQSGAIVGTPAYMAPEQAAGEPVDYRSDLFSLGCVLYRLSTGVLPFKGKDAIATLVAVAAHCPAPPAEIAARVPLELSDLVLQLLAKKPEERPESARAVAEALEEIEAPVRARSRRRPLRRACLALATLVLGVGIASLIAAWPRTAGPSPFMGDPPPHVIDKPVAVMLKNAGFEEGTDGWEMNIYGAKAQVTVDPTVVKEGRQSVRISSIQLSDAALGQEVQLKAKQRYHFSGWVRTQQLDPHGAPTCGTFQIQQQRGQGTIVSGPNHRGDTDWNQVSIVFKAPSSGKVRIACFFVGFGSGTGTAWFDGLRLEEIDLAPEPVKVTHALLMPDTIAANQYAKCVDHVPDRGYAVIARRGALDLLRWSAPLAE